MEKEERLKSKLLYKVEILLIKIIPMIISLLYLINGILYYFGMDIEAMSIIGGMSILPWLFLYISSFVFKFCLYHRLFLYYIAIEEGLAWYDNIIGIPTDAAQTLLVHIILAGVFIILITYFKFYGKRTEETNN